MQRIYFIAYFNDYAGDPQDRRYMQSVERGRYIPLTEQAVQLLPRMGCGWGGHELDDL